jgi:O-antigen ligase
MISNFKLTYLIPKILIFLLCFLPISLVLSIFVSELILITIIISFLILNYYKKDSREIYKINFLKYFIFFWLLLMVSSLLSESIDTSIRTSFFYFRFGFLVLIIKYLLDNEKKFAKYFFLSLGITLLLLSFYTFLQISILKNAVDPNRISGLFGEELVQGSYIVRTLPIFLGLLYMTDIIKDKNKLLIISIFIGIFLIIFSGERSSIANLGILLFFTLIFFPINLNKKVIFTITISIFIIFLITFFDSVWNRIIKSTMKNMFVHEKIMVFSHGHQSHFLSALKMIKNNFIIGIGPRNFRVECKKKDYEYIGKYRCSTHPHNTYLEIFTETGIFGFIAIFVLFIYIFKNLIKLLLKNNKTNYISFFFFNIGIFINIFPFLPSGSFFNNWISFLYYLPVAFFLYERKKLAIK